MTKTENSIRINTAEIPDYVRDSLAAATLRFIRDILHEPGGREKLDAQKQHSAPTQRKGGKI